MENLKILRNPVVLFTFIGLTVLIFDLNLILFQNLPGHLNKMCVPNGVLTPTNLGYIILLSILTGLLLTSIIEVIKQKTLKAKSVAGITGSALGSLVVFCPACTLPTVTIFGAAISTQFFIDYEIVIRIASISLILLGLWITNSQLKENCMICKI